jgi:hypothetical protein
MIVNTCYSVTEKYKVAKNLKNLNKPLKCNDKIKNLAYNSINIWPQWKGILFCCFCV